MLPELITPRDFLSLELDGEDMRGNLLDHGDGCRKMRMTLKGYNNERRMLTRKAKKHARGRALNTRIEK